jgi:hypothetical protein
VTIKKTTSLSNNNQNKGKSKLMQNKTPDQPYPTETKPEQRASKITTVKLVWPKLTLHRFGISLQATKRASELRE